MANMAMDMHQAAGQYGIMQGPNDFPGAKRPEYPPGMCLSIDSKTLAKLGLQQMPKVGDKFKAEVMLEVTGVSSRAGQEAEGAGTSETSVEMQITDMEMEEPEMRQPASILYPGS